MQVVSLEIRHARIRLRREVKHASQTRRESDNLIAVCTLSDGSVGYGEGVPRDYVTGETIDSAFALLRRTDLRHQLPVCPEFAAAVAAVERLRLAEIPGDERLCQGHAARCAIELSLLDAYGRAFGEPLMNVTRWIEPSLYEPSAQVRYSGVILSARAWKLRLACLAYRLLGFRQVKVKVGIPGVDDLRRLRTIRRWCGSRMELRADANEAWSVQEAARRIRELVPFGIASVEQPMKVEDDFALPQLRRECGVPIMLDESLCGEVDAERAVRNASCDLWNIRLSKLGGFIPSVRLAAMAARHHLGYQLGCQVGETGILSAAGRQFACSVRGIRAVEGSFDRRLVEDRLTNEDLTFSAWGGTAPMLPGSGLGATIDPDALDRVTVRREVLLD